MSHVPEPGGGGGGGGGVVPEDDRGAVGRAGAGHVQAQPGLDTGDRPVRILAPLLVRLAVARPDDHRCPGRGLVAVGIHAPRAAHRPQFARRGELEGLARLFGAVPDLQRRSRRVRVALHGQAPPRGRAHQGRRRRRGRYHAAQRRDHQRGQYHDHTHDHGGWPARCCSSGHDSSNVSVNIKRRQRLHTVRRCHCPHRTDALRPPRPQEAGAGVTPIPAARAGCPAPCSGAGPSR